MPISASEVRDRLGSVTRDEMDKAGLSLDELIKLLKGELKAKETKFFQKDGKVVSKRDVVAWDVRQRARMDAHKLRGDYAAEQHDVHIAGVKEVLELLNGRSTGLPSERGKPDGSGA